MSKLNKIINSTIAFLMPKEDDNIDEYYLANAPDDEIKDFILNHYTNKSSNYYLPLGMGRELKKWHLSDISYELKLVDFTIQTLQHRIVSYGNPLFRKGRGDSEFNSAIKNALETVYDIRAAYISLAMSTKEGVDYIEAFSSDWENGYLDYIKDTKNHMEKNFTLEKVRDDLLYNCRYILNDLDKEDVS
ncbi:MAG: hypothetical protein ACLFOC_09210 [Campylobacterales bacterium]